MRGLFFPLHQDIKHHNFTKHKHFKIKKVAKLDEVINESSGLQFINDSTILNINDSGGKPVLYLHNLCGKIQKQISLPLKNKDWEELAIDDKGNIFIGDFGNNANKRKDLTIYKLDKHYNMIGVIFFTYPDQHAFPPSEDQMNFDCEAFFHFKDTLYLFSKNRGNNSVKLYKLPDTPGKYKACLADSIALKGPITGADISIDKKEFTLLSYGFIYQFSVDSKILFNKPTHCFYFGRAAQSEGITYINTTDFLISNEQGKIYKFTSKKSYYQNNK